jgi:hypothetical protein
LIDPTEVAEVALGLALSGETGICRWVRAGAETADWRSPDFRDLL